MAKSRKLVGLGEANDENVWFTLLAVCAAVSLHGQEITGTFTGSVLDATGAGVPGASITVTNTDRNAVIRTAVTDSSGFNTFNHTNWASIGATLGSSTYDLITAARDPRIVQLGLKLYY